MSRANPRKALAALCPPELHAGSLTVRPMTLGTYAALERIESPMVTGKDAADTLELIPSLYLLTHDAREIFKGNILDAAMAWAQTVPVSALEDIRRMAYRQMDALFDVLPEDDGKKKRKATTAGSPTGCTGPQRSTAGASRKSSGRCPRAQSRS